MPIPRGDDHLNFTPEEAADWLREPVVRAHARRAEPQGHHGSVILAVILAVIFGLVLYNAFTPNNGVTDAPTAAAKDEPHHLDGGEMRTVSVRQREAQNSRNAPIVETPADIRTLEHFPEGWTYSYATEDISLLDASGNSIGILPAGCRFFDKLNPGRPATIVSEDGQFWGFARLSIRSSATRSLQRVYPEFQRAFEIALRVDSYQPQVADAPRANPTVPTTGGQVPPGWSTAGLPQPIAIFDGINGNQFFTAPAGICVLLELEAHSGWRRVVAPDGSFWGYALVYPLVPLREGLFLGPKWYGGLALLERLLAGDNAPPVQPFTYAEDDSPPKLETAGENY